MMSRLLNKLGYQFNDFIFNVHLFPMGMVVKYYYHSYFLKKKYIELNIKKKEFNNIYLKIRCRNGIDRKVLHYVFFDKFHHTPSVYLNKKSPVIVDLGSNIGCTIVDLKVRYPDAVIFGYEMDLENYNLAINNCSNFSKVHLFNKAVWIKNDVIKYNKTMHSDSYSITSEKDSKGILVDCVCMATIIKENSLENIDFLKMDIEGAEINILNDTDLSWLNFVLSFNI